jgi:enoyl-[acyl-carrier-protein] reductase (NADH)
MLSYLLSDKSSWTTGAILDVDGGVMVEEIDSNNQLIF